MQYNECNIMNAMQWIAMQWIERNALDWIQENAFMNTIWLIQFDESKRDECNVKYVMQWMQYDECNILSVM